MYEMFVSHCLQMYVILSYVIGAHKGNHVLILIRCVLDKNI
jgi:hypothetical protein